MIRRLVKMTFQPDQVETFLEIFEESKHKIRSMPGCLHLELWRNDNIFFTYSIWEDERALNHYRFSDVFKTVWAKTKMLFAEKAQAWSLQVQSQAD